jgi:hypothetical protein
MRTYSKDNENKIEYKTNCIECGEVFSFYRKGKLSAKAALPKFCSKCREIRIKKFSKTRRLNNQNKKSYIDCHGYRWIYINGLKFYEHRYVMSKILGRNLVKGESVHHIDGNRLNNNPSNLELWIVPQQPPGQRAKDIKCPHCGRYYLNGDIDV